MIAYCHPALNLATYQPLARRFVQSYQDNPPGTCEHDLYVLINGFEYPALKGLFSPLPVKYMTHTNVGKDIGAFQKAAEEIPCDLLICFGSPIHFHRPGWLDWIVESYLSNGPALYGAWAFHVPAVHIRTTAFWMPPDLLNAYPMNVSDGQRYEFEHGHDSITLFAQRMGYQTLQVTWEGTFDVPQWHYVGKHDTLMLDQHCAIHGIG